VKSFFFDVFHEIFFKYKKWNQHKVIANDLLLYEWWPIGPMGGELGAHFMG
jgi:hypothetical protein